MIYLSTSGAKLSSPKLHFYGEVASVVIVGCLQKGFWYPFPSSNKFIHTEDMIEFLYAVRKFPSIVYYEFAPN